MSKTLFLLPLFALSLGTFSSHLPDGANANENAFVLEEKSDKTYKISAICNDFKENIELRIYKSEEKPISEICENAFDGCVNLSTLMVSDTVTTITSSTFDNLSHFETFNYTGSEEQFSELNLSLDGVKINYFACDEGFINYWNLYVRPNDTANLCDVSRDTYKQMQLLFDELSEDDKANVKDLQDGDGTILEAIQYLQEKYKEGNKERPTKEASKSMMITLILIIASIGMTFICIFYLLRERKIIE